MKQILFVCALIMMVGLGTLYAGGASESQDAQDTPGRYENGTYVATYSHVDSRGWQPFVEIEVVDGRIQAARFDYVNPQGELKSSDQGYNERMAAAVGIAPSDAFPMLGIRLVESQSAPVDTVTGATTSTEWFNELADAVITQALVGGTNPIVLPMDQTYSAQDSPDQRGGWIGTIEVSFAADRLVSVEYDEVLRVSGEVTDRKSTNSDYAERYAEINDITPAQVYEQLETELVSEGDPGMVDTVTGATVTSTRFRRLAGEALGKRVSADLP